MDNVMTETEIRPETAPDGSPEVIFGVDLSRGFTEWLATKRISQAMTTYQVGKLILFGLDEEGDLWGSLHKSDYIVRLVRTLREHLRFQSDFWSLRAL